MTPIFKKGDKQLVKNFRPGDSTRNQLLFLVYEIHEAFEDPKSLEVRSVFRDIPKAFLIKFGTMLI